MKHIFLVLLCAIVFTWPSAAPVHAGLYQPEKIAFISEPKSALCGLRADYAITGATLRVEVLASKNESVVTVVSRVYQANSAGLMLRDIWLRTDRLLTVGQFKPAKANANGILEMRGELKPEEGNAFLKKLARGEVEISIIFYGTMPTARFPVGLPSPLPSAVYDDFQRCLT